MKLQQKLDLKRHERHGFHARKALAHVYLKEKFTREKSIKKLGERDLVALLVKVETRAKAIVPTVSTLWEALTSEHAERWVDVLIAEDEKLDKLEVFLHDVPKWILRQVGITDQFIVPSRYVPQSKMLPTGEFDRPKIRKIIQGHKYAMKKNVHYDRTFTPTPSLDSSRILEAYSVGRGLARFTFDIVSAYQHAPHDGPPLGVKYPKGFERWCENTGEELFAVLLKNLNGKPDGGRAFGKYRDKWIMETFNANGYSCKQGRKEPTAFLIQSPDTFRTHVIIHSDDCDCKTENMASVLEIADKFHTKFGIKVTNPEHMLGMVRKRYTMNGVLFEHITQGGFLLELWEEHKHLLGDNVQLEKPPKIPFPKGVRLYVGCEDVTAQDAAEVNTKGYQSIVGGIMWGNRGSAPIVSFGTNQCAKVMSAPGPKALRYALQILHYMVANREVGLVYRSDGNDKLITHYDAGFAPDPVDGKCTFGYTAHYYGGPVSWLSKKLPHVGTHVGQNEMAAQHFAGRHTLYAKYVLQEFEEKEQPLVMMYGDNDSATTFSQEDMVTSGNKYYYLPYFWIKEVEGVEVKTDRIASVNNVSDVMTKANDESTLKYLQPRLCGHTGTRGDLFEFDVKKADYLPP